MLARIALIVAILMIAFLLINRYQSQRPLYWGIALEGHSISQERLQKMFKELGNDPQIIEFYVQWPAPDTKEFTFPDMMPIWEGGAVPCLTWEPMYQDGNTIQTVLWKDLQDGKYDTYIAYFAEQVKRLSFPVIIRFAHEMNLKKYHWGTPQAEYGSSSPEIYRKMFGYVTTKFDKQNVLWAFCPNVDSIPQESWNTASQYYPGDAYIDIFGMDGYNWGTTQTHQNNGWVSTWRSFDEIFYPLYQQLQQINPKKPIVVFETASVNQGGNRRQWIVKALETCRSWNVRAIVWFHVDKEQSWQLKPDEAQVFKRNENSQEWILQLLNNRK